MSTKSGFARLFHSARGIAAGLCTALGLVLCLTGLSSAAGIRVVPSASLVGYGETFSFDVVVDGVPAQGLGTVQFRLNASAPNTVVNGVSDPSLGIAGAISLISPLTIGPSTSTGSGIGDFFWNARSANGILSIDNETLQNGTALYSLSHTNGAVLPSGSGTIARFLVKAGAGISTDHVSITLSDVALLNGDEVFPIDSNTGADVQLRCKTVTPSLLGLSYSDASNALTTAHLSVGTVYELDNQDNSRALNVVLEQSSPAGSNLFCGTTINVAVNTAPIGSIAINGGAVFTNSPTVALALGCTDAISGCSQMQLSNDNSTWSSPEPFGTAKSWQLASGNGPKTVYVKYTDGVGNTSGAYSAGITLDAIPPTTMATPAAGIYPTAQTVTLTANETATIYYTTNGSVPTTSSSVYAGPINVAQTTTIRFFGVSPYGTAEDSKSATYTIDTQKPVLVLSTLPDGSYTNNATLNIAGTATDNIAVQGVTINDAAITVNADGTFSQAVKLVTGPNTIATIAVDTAGNTTTDTRTIILDQTAPVVTITYPHDNSVTNEISTTLTGTVDKTVTVSVKVNGGNPAAATMAENSFSLPIPYIYGQNTIEVSATDLAGNTGTAKRTVTFDNVNPSLAVTNPGQDITTNQTGITLQGTVADLTGTTVTVTLDGVVSTPTVTGGKFQQPLTFNEEKTYSIVVTAVDAAGNITTVQRNVIYDKTPPALTINSVTTPTNNTMQQITGTMELGSAVTVTCPTAMVGVVSYPTTTMWQAVVADMTEGNNVVSVMATDLAGNVSAPVIAAIVLDTQAPHTTIVSGPVALTNINTASFGFTSSETGSIFECKLDQGSYAACSNPANYVNLLDGIHTVLVRATDAAGNTDQTPAAYTWIVDTIPPIAAVTGMPASPTRQTGALLTVSGDDVIAYKYQLDSGLFSAETATAAPIALAGLLDGSHRVSVVGKDSAGNWQKAENATVAAWMVDTQAPVLALSTLANGAYTNNATLNVAGTVTDNTAVSGVTINGVSATVNPDGTFSEVLTLATGTNTLTTTASDSAGNTTIDTRSIILDQTAPVITFTNPADNSVTNQIHPTVSGTVDKPCLVSIKVNNGNTAPAIMDGANFSLPTTLVYGQNTIEVTATDLAGNTSTAKRTVTFDNVSPSLAVTIPDQDVMANQPSMTLEGTVADLTIATVAVTYDGIVSAPTVTNGTFRQQLTFTTEKTYAITVTATDAAGNTTTVQRNVIYKTTPPAVTINPVTTPTNSSIQQLTGTMEVGSTVAVTCPTAMVGVVSYPTTTAWQAILADMTEGNNIVSATATDQVGNVSAPVSAAVILDTHAPVTTPSPAAGSYNTAISVSLTTNEPATVYYTTDGTTPSTASPVYKGSVLITVSTTVKFFAIDTAGNRGMVKSAVYTINNGTPKRTTTLTYTGATLIPQGMPVTLSGILKVDGTTAPNPFGQTVTFTLGGSQSCAGTTDAGGNVSCTISSVTVPLGPTTVTATFSGDAYYQPSSDSKSVIVFAFSSTGGFVIGDQNAAVNSAVTFWGAQWWQENSLSGGQAPTSFKGYADNMSATPPSCGGTWNTNPGNSSKPPGSIPAYMAVLVSSSISNSADMITGNMVKIVIVKTNSGYGPDPGHGGTGTVVGVLCEGQ